MGERITTELARELVGAATPGPWRVESASVPAGESAWGEVVARQHPAGGAGAPIPGMRCMWGGRGADTMQGRRNAAIIAAAPDLAADLIAARERIAALEAERDARVTVEEHARAVREAWHEGRSSAPEDYWAASPRQRNVDAAWRESSAIDDLRDLLAHRGGPERAAALADGVGGDS